MPVTPFGNDLLLYDLRKLPRTTQELLALLPTEVGGVYAFYLPLEPPGYPLGSAEELATAFANRLRTPRFSNKRANIPPGHSVTLRSRVQLPERKRAALQEMLSNPEFRTYLGRVIQYDFLFSSPLYIGKADSFRARLQQHLDGSSGLKEELSDHGIHLNATKLLLLTVPFVPPQDSVPSAIIPLDSPHTHITSFQPNLIIEDLLSRLALPGFTKRLG